MVETDNILDFWVARLCLNLLGYATIIVPCYIFIRWVRKSGYLDRAGSGFWPNLVRLFVADADEKTGLEDAGKDTSTSELSGTKKAVVLCFCVLGLQVSYLIWGLLQERIMAFRYGQTESFEGENFKNSLFLVFMNRILAFVSACVVILCQRQPKHKAPLYKYSYSSFSNIMSSWCQYEALKFVSFPTQVLAKASKVIPVMLMGKVVSQKTFEYYEYLTAVMISLGVSMFLLTSGDAVKDNGTVTTFSGVIILVGYLLFDAFTSNWQGELFKRYKMSSIQMMAGVNFCSVVLTSVSLIEQGGFIESASFMMRYPTFMFHVCILSLCSATGQLFIFYTIAQFGPVIFTIIMTVRQGLAILLSCLIYSHPVTAIGFVGVLVVFAAIFIRIYCARRLKQLKALKAARSVKPPADVPEVLPKA